MKYNPHNYQSYCTNRIISDDKLALWLDMGLGKTVITLTAINELKYNRFLISKALIIAPKKVAETTWSREAEKWDHLRLLRVMQVLGSKNKREQALNTPADVYVVNRENVQWIVEYYGNSWPFDMVVIDESSSFKNHQAKRFKALKMVLGKIHRLVELTGTPAPKSLIDLWAQIYLLDEGARLGKRIGHFRETYFDPDQRNAERIFTYRPKEGAEKNIQLLLSDICVSMKSSDYLNLPEMTVVDVPVMLDGRARKIYDEFERSMLLKIDEQTVDADTAAVLSNKLLQAAGGEVYDDEHTAMHIHDCKIDSFLELVEGLNGQSAIVFYSFQHERYRILKALKKTSLNVRVYNGPQDELDWNKGKIDILLAHPASTAYGLNLQDGGRHVIWFGLTWSLELYAQANKRLHRQGQQGEVIIHRFIAEGTRDEDVITALEDKGNTQESLLRSLKARIEKVKGANKNAKNSRKI